MNNDCYDYLFLFLCSASIDLVLVAGGESC